MNKKVRVGSRDSLLAVRQAELVMEVVRKASPETELTLVTMKTTGDRILNQSLDKIGGKGLFVKELDLALMEGRSDLSVHSLKDMPMEIPEELPILAYSPREDNRDVLVLREGLSELPAHPVIGTGSARRKIQAARIYPDAEFKGIRGNIQTRLRKLDSGEYDALILAAAGMIRMGLQDRISRYFSVEEIIPPAGQGIMAVQGRKDDSYPFLIKINSPKSQAMAEAERSFVKTLDGGCSSPIAACALIEGDRLKLRGLYFEEKSGRWVVGSLEGSVQGPAELGRSLALRLKSEIEQEKV
ncbi:hydroxymethylbilane synthase [Clostridium sp. M62/1]|uniref:hydroxymethylbilane synthase n=1 Tax=Clostridium sp. M62/1 TaxID=411486 RepID=UPI0035637214